MQDSITHEALEALSKAATQGLLIVPERDAHTDRTSAHVSNDLPSVFVACAGKPTEQREADTLFLAALWNAYRTGQLVPAQPSGDVVEAVARAIKAKRDAMMRAEAEQSDGTLDYDEGPWEEWREEATAAITAYEAVSGVAKMREALKAVNDAETPSSWEAAVDGLIEAARAALGEKP